jgi:predicted dehydrogenase
MQALLAENACRGRRRRRPVARGAARVQALAPGARPSTRWKNCCGTTLDGVVIATPSALHAQQALAALERGLAVFCQKPLARTAQENARHRRSRAQGRPAARLRPVLPAHRGDAPHPQLRGRRRARAGVRRRPGVPQRLRPGQVLGARSALAGGGCAIDLGIHLVDLALWTLGFPGSSASPAACTRRASGCRLAPTSVEDYAVAQLELAGGAVVRIACSWNLSGGRDAVIEAHFHGSRGGAAMQQRQRLVLRLRRRALPRHAAHAAGRTAGRLGRPGHRRLGAAAGRRRALRKRHRIACCRWPTVLDRIYGR